MPRSLKKGPYVDETLSRRVRQLNNTNEKRVLKTWRRRSMISPDMIGHSIAVHNGKTFQTIYVDENMVGHKLGEFAPTRFFKSHGGKQAKAAKLK